MCYWCDDEGLSTSWDTPLPERAVPCSSGEAAIYTPEYLAQKEGNAKGAAPQNWSRHVI